MISVYVTCKNAREAKSIARMLLEKKLIACANIFSSDSLYSWKGKIRSGKEHVMLGKTIEKNFQKIGYEIKKVHSYQIPCILSFKIEKGNEKYVSWVNKELNQ